MSCLSTRTKFSYGEVWSAAVNSQWWLVAIICLNCGKSSTSRPPKLTGSQSCHNSMISCYSFYTLPCQITETLSTLPLSSWGQHSWCSSPLWLRCISPPQFQCGETIVISKRNSFICQVDFCQIIWNGKMRQVSCWHWPDMTEYQPVQSASLKIHSLTVFIVKLCYKIVFKLYSF